MYKRFVINTKFISKKAKKSRAFSINVEESLILNKEGSL